MVVFVAECSPLFCSPTRRKMVKKSSGPGDLRLKKELTALQKARFLRDPETCSSWRSPLNTTCSSITAVPQNRSPKREVTVAAGGGGRRISSGGMSPFPAEKDHDVGRELEAATSQPSSAAGKEKSVFLYNWSHRTSGKGKWSFSGVLGGDGGRIHPNRDEFQGSVNGSSVGVEENNLSDSLKEDSVLDSVDESSTGMKRAERRQRNRREEKANRPNRHHHRKSDDFVGDSLCDLSKEPNSRTESPLLLGYSVGSEDQIIPKDEKWHRSSKLLRSLRRGESSYTPGSTRNPSLISSWDGTASLGDDDFDGYLDAHSRSGCGIPCYWSKKMKYKNSTRCYSPSFSDALFRKSNGMLSTDQSSYLKGSPSWHRRSKISGKPLQDAAEPPLLTNGRDPGASSVDELSVDIGEIDLEAANRLEGRRWSCCRRSDAMDLSLFTGRGDGLPEGETPRSLSQKYRPRSFEELVGLKIVVQSLVNALSKGRIAPMYLFQGPSGTGKTSVARIFAAALNCSSANESKPCGVCKECLDMVAGKATSSVELDATNKKAIAKVKQLLEHASVSLKSLSRMVLIIDECHMLSVKTWMAFLNLMDELPSHLVFVFITTEPENLPRGVASRCQRFFFPKIKEVDIIRRLKKLAVEENMEFEMEALDLIALHSDGSLRDAETMLEQLGLLGKKITVSLVNDFSGVVSDDKLLDLLELAMSSNTSETVKRARELMETGVDPLALMSQLASLIMDIIAGTDSSKCSGSSFEQQSLTEVELERLRHALKILSDAEKQLRLSSDRSTWFTAALLQIGSSHYVSPAHPKDKIKQAMEGMGSFKDFTSLSSEEFVEYKKNSVSANGLHEATSLPPFTSQSGRVSWNGVPSSCITKVNDYINDYLGTCSRSVNGESMVDEKDDTNAGRSVCINKTELDEIWKRVVQRCHSKTLGQLLFADGKLASVSEENGVLVASIIFKRQDQKARAERFLKRITNSMEIVLRHSVKVTVGLSSEMPITSSRGPSEVPNAASVNHIKTSDVSVKKSKSDINQHDCSGEKSEREASICNLSNPEGSMEDGTDNSSGPFQPLEKNINRSTLPVFRSQENGCFSRRNAMNGNSDGRTGVVVDEQRLESAWLQVAEKSTLASKNQPRSAKNQVLPHDHGKTTMLPVAVLGHPMEDTNLEIPSIADLGTRSSDGNWQPKDRFPMTPSLLHTNSRKYESDAGTSVSAPGCSRILCWKTKRPRKVKQVKSIRHVKARWCSCVRCCGKA